MVAAARSSAPASLLRPSKNAAHCAGFGLVRAAALAHLGSGTPPRTGAVLGPCLEMANMEQSTTAALLLLIKNPRHQAAQHKTALLLRVATQQCSCVHVRSRLSTSRRCGFDCSRAIEGAGARHEDSDEKHKTTPPLHDPRASHSSPAFIKFCERSAVRVVVHT